MKNHIMPIKETVIPRGEGLEVRLIDGLLPMQPHFQANVPSINLVSKPM